MYLELATFMVYHEIFVEMPRFNTAALSVEFTDSFYKLRDSETGVAGLSIAF